MIEEELRQKAKESATNYVQQLVDQSEMCIPNCAFELAERMFDEWVNETREKKAVELLTKEEKK